MNSSSCSPVSLDTLKRKISAIKEKNDTIRNMFAKQQGVKCEYLNEKEISDLESCCGRGIKSIEYCEKLKQNPNKFLLCADTTSLELNVVENKDDLKNYQAYKDHKIKENDVEVFVISDEEDNVTISVNNDSMSVSDEECSSSLSQSNSKFLEKHHQLKDTQFTNNILKNHLSLLDNECPGKNKRKLKEGPQCINVEDTEVIVISDDDDDLPSAQSSSKPTGNNRFKKNKFKPKRDSFFKDIFTFRGDKSFLKNKRKKKVLQHSYGKDDEVIVISEGEVDILSSNPSSSKIKRNKLNDVKFTTNGNISNKDYFTLQDKESFVKRKGNKVLHCHNSKDEVIVISDDEVDNIPSSLPSSKLIKRTGPLESIKFGTGGIKESFQDESFVKNNRKIKEIECGTLKNDLTGKKNFLSNMETSFEIVIEEVDLTEEPVKYMEQESNLMKEPVIIQEIDFEEDLDEVLMPDNNTGEEAVEVWLQEVNLAEEPVEIVQKIDIIEASVELMIPKSNLVKEPVEVMVQATNFLEESEVIITDKNVSKELATALVQEVDLPKEPAEILIQEVSSENEFVGSMKQNSDSAKESMAVAILDDTMRERKSIEVIVQNVELATEPVDITVQKTLLAEKPVDIIMLE